MFIGTNIAGSLLWYFDITFWTTATMKFLFTLIQEQLFQFGIPQTREQDLESTEKKVNGTVHSIVEYLRFLGLVWLMESSTNVTSFWSSISGIMSLMYSDPASQLINLNIQRLFKWKSSNLQSNSFLKVGANTLAAWWLQSLNILESKTSLCPTSSGLHKSIDSNSMRFKSVGFNNFEQISKLVKIGLYLAFKTSTYSQNPISLLSICISCINVHIESFHYHFPLWRIQVLCKLALDWAALRVQVHPYKLPWNLVC